MSCSGSSLDSSREAKCPEFGDGNWIAFRMS
jgi:hypothetical protein